jgi:hypothetical protein
LERPHLNPPLRGEEKEGLQGGQEGRVSAEENLRVFEYHNELFVRIYEKL